MQGRWVQSRSEYYLQLRGHSERELQIASAELRKRYQKHAGDAAITAKRLAALLAEAQAHEEVLVQRLQDLEARDVFAQMGGYRLLQEEQAPPLLESMRSPFPPGQQSGGGEVLTLGEQAGDEEDEDLEDLEEYEEYR